MTYDYLRGLDVWAVGPDGKRYRLVLIGIRDDGKALVEFIDGHRAWINAKEWRFLGYAN